MKNMAIDIFATNVRHFGPTYSSTEIDGLWMVTELRQTGELPPAGDKRGSGERSLSPSGDTITKPYATVIDGNRSTVKLTFGTEALEATSSITLVCGRNSHDPSKSAGKVAAH